jgi:hypothetical protein
VPRTLPRRVFKRASILPFFVFLFVFVFGSGKPAADVLKCMHRNQEPSIRTRFLKY